MAVTAASVKVFAPQFAAVADANITTWISFAPTHISADTFGTAYDQAVLLWVCHQLQSTQPEVAGAAGPITGITTGDVSVSTSAGSGQGGYQRTAYGQQYLALRRLYVAGPRVV